MNIPRRGLGDMSVTEAADDFSLLAWGIAALFGFLVVMRVTGK